MLVKPLKGVPSTAWSFSATAFGRFSSPVTVTLAAGITDAHVGGCCSSPSEEDDCSEESTQSGVSASHPYHSK